MRVKPLIGGLEISDIALRFVHKSKGIWHFVAIRLEPGIFEEGKIKSSEKFIAALKNLKSQAFPEKKLRKIPVVVSFSSVSIYSQVFSLPIIQGENLDRAVQLNVEMISPIDTSRAYSGWQKVGEDQESLRLDVLSAFIDRAVVDEITKALLAADFIPVVVESRALSLARLLREEGLQIGLDMNKSYVLIRVDDSGIDFLIIRLGQLYFEYFNSWRNIADEKGAISSQAFEAAVIRSLHQVVNFYNQHWTGSPSEVVLSAAALKDETKKIIADNFSFTVRDLIFKDQETAPEWYIALGCGLRGESPRSRDRELSLLGIGAQEEFREEQVILFLGFWRVLVPVVLGLFLCVFSLSYLFLTQTSSGLKSQSLLSLGDSGLEEGRVLQTQAQEFNHLVELFNSVRAAQVSESTLIEKIRGIAESSGIMITRIYFQSPSIPILFNGEVRSEDKLTAFKNALTGDPGFKDVNLNLIDIHKSPTGLSFLITFRLNQ